MAEVNRNTKDSYDPKARWMIQYAEDLAKQPGEEGASTGLKSYRTKLGMFWDVVWTKKVRDACAAGRMRIFQTTPKGE